MKNGILLAIFPLLLAGTSLFGAGNGLRGDYFNDTGLLGTPVLTRTDATVNFEWATGGPGLGIDDNFFSARWTGQVEATASGAFRFATVSNNGVRLWVNNVEVINHWSAHGNDKDTSAPLNLTAGQKYDLKMEFYENTNIATARLLWTPPGQPEAVVPQERLYSPATGVPAVAPVYLSSLTPTSQTNGWGPYQRDRSNGEQGASDGRILSIGGIDFARGLGVHARSELHYALQGQFQSFLAQIGLDDEVGSRGSVAFEVWLDGLRVFASPVLHGTNTAQPVNVSVTGKNELKLVVLDGGDGIDFDHADWADAHLVAAIGTITIPPAPQNVSAAAGDRHVKVSWSASPGASSYNVYRGTSANGEATDPIVGGLTDTSFNDTVLTNGTKYYYRVIAVNNSGMSARSLEVSGTPGGNGGGTPPPAPAGLTGTGGDKQVTLSWTASAGATSYALFLGTAANGESSTPLRAGITGTTFTDTGLTNGIKYFFKLAAMNGGNMSAMSNETSATPAGAPPPPAPAGLTSKAGDKQVTLTWTAIPTAGATYNIFRGTTSNGEAGVAVAGGLTSPTFTSMGLTNGTTYFFKVTATVAGVSSAMSNETSATPAGAPPPPAPAGLTSKAGDKQVTLTWTAIPTAGATYNIFRGTTSNGEAGVAVAGGLTSPTFTSMGLTDGTTYFFKVTATVAGVSSAMSNETSATPAGAPPPPAPTGLTSTAGDKQAVLAWTAIPTAGATYSVFRGTATNGESSTAVATGLTSPAFTNTGLTNGTTYFFKVTAAVAGVSSAMSNETSATPAGAPPPPAPTGLTSTAGDKQAVLAWTAIPTVGATYSVFRGTVTNGESSTAVATGLTSPAFANTGLTNGTTYFFKVTATVAGVSSAMSNETSATPAGAPPPPAPTGLTSTAGDKQAVLGWTAIPTAGATYSVFRGTATNGESSTAVATGLTSPAFTNTGLTNGTTYFFKVTAAVAGVSSAMSNETSATPAPPPPPPTPTGLTATPGDKQVVLGWTAIATPGATYSVFRGTTSNGESATAIATALTSPTFTNTGLTNGTTYFFKVTAVVGGVSSAMSAEATGSPAPPSAPTGLSATAGDKQVILSWNTVAGAASYNVYRGTAANGESSTALATGLTTATFTDTGLTNGTTYFYKVAAVNAANTVGTKSAEASAMPTAPGTILTQAQQDAFKFLRQSTFGPTPALVDHVVAIGKPAFIDEQMALPPTPYPDTLIQMPNMELVSEQFFQNAMQGQDQLRQRVGWALSQIFVASAIKVDNTDAMVPYIRLLEQSAFGNVKDIMHDVSLSPAMGEFLDMVDNKKLDPVTGALPNENYAREWLQLFSIGLVQLQNNGQPVAGNPPTYDQSSVADMARVLTGWTYGDTKATNPTNPNPPFYGGPMKPVEKYHDTGAKTVLGVSFPAGQGTQADFDMALNTVFNHPNVGPFLVRELIQRLVTSNPSPTYISDVVAVFNNNGQGVRGDLAAVVKAILLHPEASTTGSATFGKFAEPALFLTTVCRVICTNITDQPFMSDFSQNMAQQIWFAPSVFNYFSPNFRAGALFAPELQIWSTANAMTRTNWLASLLSGGFGGSVTLSLAPFTAVAADPNALADTVNALLMGGTMPTQMRGALITAITATSNTTERVNTALYVAASSMQYQVEH